MKRGIALLFTAIFGALVTGTAHALYYPVCLLNPVPGADAPVVLIPQSIYSAAVQGCIKGHMEAHLPALAVSNTSFRVEPGHLAQRYLEQYQANMALVDVETDLYGLKSILGMAVALDESLGMEQVPALRAGDDWKEVGRLTAIKKSGEGIVRHLQGSPKYWGVLRKWSPQVLSSEDGNMLERQGSQHFHLVQIRCK